MSEDKQIKMPSLFVGMLCYGNLASMPTTQGLIQLQAICSHYGIPLQWGFIGNESLVTRGRNRLTHMFLKTDCTHFVAVDADIGFKAEDIIKLIYRDKEFVGGAYCAKGINWDGIKTALKFNPDLGESDLEKAAGKFVVGLLDDHKNFAVNALVPVAELGGGFLCIRREVFTKIIDTSTDIKISYEPHVGDDVYKFWDTGMSPLGDSDREISEDYWLCHLWRKAGGTVWLDPTIDLNHVGSYVFKGSFTTMANLESGNG